MSTSTPKCDSINTAITALFFFLHFSLKFYFLKNLINFHVEDVMDPRIAWIQPELFGPPTEFWQRLGERFNQLDEPVNTNTSTEAENDQKRTPNKTALTEAYRELQAEKQARLARELNIGELSPLSRGPEQRSENAAGTSELDYQEQRRNHAQNGMWRTQRKYPGGVAGLHLEIVDFYNWIKSTPEEYVMRYDVVNRFVSPN